MDDSTLLIICVAGAVALLGYFITMLFAGDRGGKLRSRLAEQREPVEAPTADKTAVMPMLQKLGQAAAEPFMPKKRETQSEMRRRLAYAGVYAPNAVSVIQGMKVILLGAGLVGGYGVGLMMNQVMLFLAFGGLLGYLSPIMWLKSRIKSNQQALRYSLPDALDLMVVCVEAGLTVDAAMQRVGQELAIAHPALSREIGMTHMETRVGLSRAEALKNLGTRTGSAPLQSLSSMLIQADRFGTSIASALRIHAESLREARQHAAEELAAKASVKMSFPLVLFIFPATFIVLAGPTVIGLMKSAIMN
jgi:tight adherence protein C